MGLCIAKEVAPVNLKMLHVPKMRGKSHKVGVQNITRQSQAVGKTSP
jgi:hypothetical protein